MAISVRELPPLALHVQATTPSGRTQRWGPDERAPENVPQNLSFSTVMPGGNENFSCDLPRMESRAYSDLTLLSNICVRGAGGRIAGEFRLEKAPRATGDQKIVSPQGVGYQAHLADDNTAAEVYVDRDLTHWREASVSTKIVWLRSSSSSPWMPVALARTSPMACRA